ncbi:MAG: inositol monophosphatase family protein [Chlamydiota bacterium]|nr:inositol monophosphatase family protein [Chlamydiota bacterium]
MKTLKEHTVDMPFMIAIAKEAGQLQMRYFQKLKQQQIKKKSYKDYVTIVDQLSEQLIIKRIRSQYPNHEILAEESGGKQLRHTRGPIWVIDPLDGTTNFIHGIPIFSVSIAFFNKGKVFSGVVYDPARNEAFYAQRQKGAYLNGKRIHVSRCNNVESALLATGIPFRKIDILEPYIRIFRKLCMAASGIRRCGSAALDLVYTASGRYDGFWEFGLNVWDIAAGSIIVKEAGGKISDFDAKQQHLLSGNIICGNPVIYKKLLQCIRDARV